MFVQATPAQSGSAHVIVLGNEKGGSGKSTTALHVAVALLKANSSKWMNEHRRRFSWQEGYGAFSVSASNLDAVVRYIDNQEKHHRKITFEDEFIGLLKRHKIDYDPKYVFG